MKRLIMFALSVILAFGLVGFANAQTSEWQTGTFVYSTGGDSLVTGVTISTTAIDLRTAMTVGEDPNTVDWHQNRSTTAYKFPTEISFQWKSTETLTNSDSINAIKKVQFSADGVTWDVAVALDTLISLTTDTSATVSESHVLSKGSFPALRYMRVQTTDASASGDTSTVVDKYSLRFGQ